MKDVQMQKETLVPSSLAESSKIPCDPSLAMVNDTGGKVRRSATLIGLAISLSAFSIALPHHRAAATGSPVLRSTLHHLPPTLSPASMAISADSLGETAHSSQPGRPQIISGARPIALLSESKSPTESSHSLAIASNASLGLDASKEHLREARKRLQEGLNELKANTDASTAEGKSIQIQAEDVSQPLLAAETSTSPPPIQILPRFNSGTLPLNKVSELRQTPIAASTLETFETNFDRPIPIPVPTPESSLPKAIAPKPRFTPNNTLNKTLAAPTLESPAEPPSLSAFNQPIPIPVPTPSSPRVLTAPQPDSLPVIEREPFREFSAPSQSYQVQPGDTLNSIARRHGVSVAELARANRISNPNLIEVSQALVIPSLKPQIKPATSRSAAIATLPAPRLIEERNGDSHLPTAIAANPIVSSSQPAPVIEMAAEKTLVADAAPTEKLKADIANLETTYGQPLAGETTSVVEPPELIQMSSASQQDDEPINPEWKSDRLTLDSKTLPTQPLAYKPKEEQLVGAAPTNAQDYNNSLRLPVGYEVSPELPPLSSPDNYLPDTPIKFSGNYIWPAKGVLTSGFGRRWGRMHRGIDIAAPIGTPIVAAAPGEVVFAGWNSGGYGNLVKVRHDDGSITLYAHNSRIFVRRGQQVNQGEPIAAMGSTGYSTGPHLHFEIHEGGKSAVNPIAYLPSSRN